MVKMLEVQMFLPFIVTVLFNFLILCFQIFNSEFKFIEVPKKLELYDRIRQLIKDYLKDSITKRDLAINFKSTNSTYDAYVSQHFFSVIYYVFVFTIITVLLNFWYIFSALYQYSRQKLW